MARPRFFIEPPQEPWITGATLPLTADASRHAQVLRLHPGDGIEVAWGDGNVWLGDIVEIQGVDCRIRLVRPLTSTVELPVRIEVCIPILAQLSAWDDALPALGELGATVIQPVIFQRSEYDARKLLSRYDRWKRVLERSAEQSHRVRRVELKEVISFESLLTHPIKQRWVAYEQKTDRANPELIHEDLVITSGPEGGYTDQEIHQLMAAQWQPISLGPNILRAVTAPTALLGAAVYRLGISKI